MTPKGLGKARPSIPLVIAVVRTFWSHNAIGARYRYSA